MHAPLATASESRKRTWAPTPATHGVEPSRRAMLQGSGQAGPNHGRHDVAFSPEKETMAGSGPPRPGAHSGMHHSEHDEPPQQRAVPSGAAESVSTPRLSLNLSITQPDAPDVDNSVGAAPVTHPHVPSPSYQRSRPGSTDASDGSSIQCAQPVPSASPAREYPAADDEEPHGSQDSVCAQIRQNTQPTCDSNTV